MATTITFQFETSDFADAVMEYFDNSMCEKSLVSNAFADDNILIIYDVDLSDWVGREIIETVRLSIGLAYKSLK